MTAIAGLGTPERLWRPFLHSLDLPALALQDPPARVVVVAPHPDDEVLAVGGLLALLGAAGTRVEVLAVTDGEASHPGGSLDPQALAGRRRAESVAALQVLGLRARIHRLRLPDGGRGVLEQPVTDALRLDPGTWLLGPWLGDGHPDHEAVGRACVAAAVRDGARLLSYPVWAWHWAVPGDPRLPWATAARVELPPAIQVRKAAAVAQFVSQTQAHSPEPADAPVLPPHVLARFSRTSEVVFT